MRDRVAACLMLATGGGIMAFWVLFFTAGLAPDPAPPCYFAFEHSFPLPDLFLAAALMAAGVLVLSGRSAGRKLALAASGALVFLGSLDFSFNIQNGVYRVSPAELFSNAGINLWCVGFGIFLFLSFFVPPSQGR